ncbi:hypothetical protein FIBSPDRAFT_550670 [Athelia psychrophila]|uniref:Uncharacterized protein n=1 Tax=Athelia psychrophila TaxID=1759441 RepID=A0A166UTM0_9AGAM|nr:hypothetical protein FIBSPDRAFT_550670 [Fibularhizoctonia sp. CBS 109695]
MVYSTLDNWDGSLSGSQTDNKRPRRSASSPPTALESPAEHSLPVQLTSNHNTPETGMFVHSGLLADSPTPSKTMTRASTQDRADTTTMTIPQDLRASNTDLLRLQESDDEMQVDSTLVSIALLFEGGGANRRKLLDLTRRCMHMSY